MAHIILTGATGTAGSTILSYALASPAVAKVSILSRRPVKLAEGQSKANVIIHKDFDTYPSELLEQLKGASGCIWAQGISSRGMQEAEYTRITVDYPVAAAKAMSGALDGKVNFVYVSGEGADVSEKSSFMFGRVKGRAERTLLELQKEQPGLSVYNVRPAGINPQWHYEAERKPNLNDHAASLLGGVLECVWKSMVIPTPKLAEACVKLATGDGEPVPAGVGVEADGRLLRNTALRRLAGM